MSIVLIINYSRSGGTILSKCLGSLDDTVVISEVNPHLCAKYSVREQAKRWYNIDLKHDNYLDSVLELYQICININKRLIIRDWTFIDFTPSSLNNFTPSGKLSNMALLKKEVDVQAVGFIRDAIDIWISRWMPPNFFPYYKNYINALTTTNIPLFKYEDFCEDPELILKKICFETGLNFSESYKNYIEFNNTTGDNTSPIVSRGGKNKVITSLKRKKIPRSIIKELNGNSDMIEINKIMKYPTNYFDREIDDKGNIFLLELKHHVKKILKIPTRDQY
jgi:hypothetical protein